MNSDKKVITNGDDIYLYFEIMRQFSPRRVLDVGPFLRRCGAIARQAMNCEIGENVFLCGLNLLEDELPPVYSKIYNAQYNDLDSLAKAEEEMFDLTFFLGNSGLLDVQKKKMVWNDLLAHSRCILVDTEDREFTEYIIQCSPCQDIAVESKHYILAAGAGNEGSAVQEGGAEQEAETNRKSSANQEAGDRTVALSTEQAHLYEHPDIRIYIAAHKQFTSPSQDRYIPLHVGRAGKKDLGYIGDDMGENISVKNANYCELTGVYWMWKNISCDIIGLCHYRRYFARNGEILAKETIERILQDYDVIVGNSSMAGEGSVYKHYEAKHPISDLELCRTVIKELEPEYLQAFEYCMQSNLMNVGNMMISSKQIFDQYCAWLFPILMEVERRSDLSNYDTYQKRIYGFLSERLLRVWVMMQDMKVREEEIIQIG